MATAPRRRLRLRRGVPRRWRTKLAPHPKDQTPKGRAALWLQVRDVYATEKELAGRGVPIAREARQEPWGLHEMHVTDPDSVTLIFVQVPETHPLRRDTRN